MKKLLQKSTCIRGSLEQDGEGAYDDCKLLE